MKYYPAILVVMSGIVCVLLGIIFPISYHINVASYDKASKKWIQSYSIDWKTNFRAGFENGSLWFYNYECPWVGGIRYIGDETGIFYKGGHAHRVEDFVWHIGGDYGICHISLVGEHGEIVDKERDCRLPGIYYCYFSPVDYPPPEWTLKISLWYPIILFAIPPALWIYQRVRLHLEKSRERQQ